MPLPVELYLENCVDDFSLIPPETWENWFQEWLEILNDYLPTALSYEVSLRLTTDTEIQTLNSQYREQDKPTDVLAFASLEANLPQSEEMLRSMPLYLGDIIVSVDTAQRQAQQQEHSLSTELAWLTAHGLLHLLGWDHPDERSLMEMLHQQVILLEKIGMSINLEV
ncbi:rRNA maturation RNase YbeY [Dolichospermum planctonicum CS-1226]|uniref:Endoribonuclease YbeY n=1 Tax=Dolichospermum planctonicum CS-1226 TaxID=3021751 RepID=A0ABT5AKK8_9CYAN|nr:rRNA maturation RNase YbeY [Dolichospermum planctonicum]MDB9537848.1 rRNA maturation RNase YbeY [Dolichospermum planctonicum CS-1226]